MDDICALDASFAESELDHDFMRPQQNAEPQPAIAPRIQFQGGRRLTKSDAFATSNDPWDDDIDAVDERNAANARVSQIQGAHGQQPESASGRLDGNPQSAAKSPHYRFFGGYVAKRNRYWGH
jgi:hypothetical protein